MTDYALLQAWGAGDDDAGDALVTRYVPVLYRFFRNKLDTDVDELAQRTLMACVESRERLRKDASFRSYLLAIARRQLMMHLRKRMRGDRAHRVAEVPVDEVLGSPSEVARHKEELKLLSAVLRRIPLDLQITLELHYWEELPVAEIAEVLEIPVGTVKSRLHRAREVLRTAIEAADADEHLRRSTIANLDGWARELREQLDRQSP